MHTNATVKILKTIIKSPHEPFKILLIFAYESTTFADEPKAKKMKWSPTHITGKSKNQQGLIFSSTRLCVVQKLSFFSNDGRLTPHHEYPWSWMSLDHLSNIPIYNSYFWNMDSRTIWLYCQWERNLLDLQATWNKRMNGLTRKTLPGSRCPQKLMGQWIVCINCCLSFSPPLPSPKRKNTLGTLKTINTLLLQTGDGQPLTLNDPYYFEPN